MKTRHHICLVTAAHLSTCPRLLKAADALSAAGYRVRVVSARHTAWATLADADVWRSRARAWKWTIVDHTRGTPTYIWTGARFRVARVVARALGRSRSPLSLVAQAYGRIHSELVRKAVAEPVELFYGGTAQALAATAEAGRRTGVPFALDLEDFHSDEQDPSPGAALAHALATRIEGAVLPRAAFLTASSAAIAAAYADSYGVQPIAVHNTFPLPARPPRLEPGEGPGLRLYWFSQTIGAGRGLEDVVQAMGLAGIQGELHLRGRPAVGYLDGLKRLAVDAAPSLKIIVHEPAPPDAMVELCADYDGGLSLEQGHVRSRALCLTNKALTYILAGLPVVLTNTAGHQALAAALGEAALVYAPRDVATLAVGLKRWAQDRQLRARARAAAWEAARRRWHWEHPEDRGALLEAVAKVLR